MSKDKRADGFTWFGISKVTDEDTVFAQKFEVLRSKSGECSLQPVTKLIPMCKNEWSDLMNGKEDKNEID